MSSAIGTYRNLLLLEYTAQTVLVFMLEKLIVIIVNMMHIVSKCILR